MYTTLGGERKKGLIRSQRVKQVGRVCVRETAVSVSVGTNVIVSGSGKCGVMHAKLMCETGWLSECAWQKRGAGEAFKINYSFWE